jgi:hypothetical protein
VMYPFHKPGCPLSPSLSPAAGERGLVPGPDSRSRFGGVRPP